MVFDFCIFVVYKTENMKNLFETKGTVVFDVVSNIELPKAVTDFNEVFYNYISEFDFEASRIVILYKESNHHTTLGVVVATTTDDIIAKWVDCSDDYFYSDMLKNGLKSVEFNTDCVEWTKIDVYTEVLCGMNPHEDYYLPDGFVELLKDYIIN